MVHKPQSPNAQSSCCCGLHEAPPGPWQASISARTPPSSSLPQGLPLPVAFTAICRLRARVPEHWSAQLDHPDQSLYAQSTSWTHSTSLLQRSAILEMPSAGFPQWFPSTAMLRARKR